MLLNFNQSITLFNYFKLSIKNNLNIYQKNRENECLACIIRYNKADSLVQMITQSRYFTGNN